MRFRPLGTVCVCIGLLVTLGGCGGGSKSSSPSSSVTPPVIKTHPSNQTVAPGQSATFTASASGGGPLTYQWQKDGTAITGATDPVYTTPPVTLADNGAKFGVLVSNPAGSTSSSPATLTVSSSAPAAPAITQQPANQAVTAGSAATFSVAATGAGPLAYQWQKDGTAIAGATSAAYTTPATAASDSGAKFAVVVSNTSGSVTSSAATLTVNASVASSIDVVTYHNDLARTGQNLNETILTPANVNSATFGKIRSLPVDGKVDAQPLYLAGLQNIGGGTHNVLYVATEHDSVYAFDADSGAQLWKVSMLGAGESPSDTRGCDQITPEIGVTATPVIDRTAGPNGAIYVVAMSKDSSGNYFQRLHALDVTTGGELFSGPRQIDASFPGTGDNSSNGRVVFDAAQYKDRAALLLLNGIVYTTWASHCDIRPYTGWIIGYNQTTLAQTTVLNVVPNGSEGAIWMADTGPSADSAGNIYLLDANGDFDTTLNASGFPSNGNYGNAFLKLSSSGGLSVADYFEMHNQQQENDSDDDLGSGGALVLPDLTDNSGATQHLAVGAGKDGHIYVVNRDAMGKYSSSGNNIYQELTGVLGAGVFSMPAYFNNTIYYCAIGDAIKAFKIAGAKLSTSPSFQSGNSFPYPGATPSISANGSSNGILWAAENASAAVLHAYDASNLHELYNSNQASGSRDQFGTGDKFITPTIANGKVFVGTTNSVGVFGLLQ
ncbi:MAG TPA: immunoglobulin domain-containing protein [Terriglobales bacterium]|nr:immunoglobulin domain-containing protein [Terriglobales bacterium]